MSSSFRFFTVPIRDRPGELTFRWKWRRLPGIANDAALQSAVAFETFDQCVADACRHGFDPLEASAQDLIDFHGHM